MHCSSKKKRNERGREEEEEEEEDEQDGITVHREHHYRDCEKRFRLREITGKLEGRTTNYEQSQNLKELTQALSD